MIISIFTDKHVELGRDPDVSKVTGLHNKIKYCLIYICLTPKTLLSLLLANKNQM